MNQLIVIDPNTATIEERMQVGKDLHLAQVVLDNESKNAFVTAEETNEVIQVDATSYQVVRKFDLGAEHVPHGLRYSHGKLYVANTGSKSMSVINVSDGKISDIPLGGMAVQTAVTRDGKFVLVSLYDTKEVSVIDIYDAKVLSTIKAGNMAHGVVSSKDGQTVFVTNTMDNTVSIIDVTSQKVVDTIPVGKDPNGISFWFETGGMP